MAVVPIKSKGVAYLLWFFLGLFGAHRFYLEKIGTGFLFLFTGGVLGVGWLIDLFTLGGQVDLYNALHGNSGGNVNQNQNVVVNVTAPTVPINGSAITQKVSAEKEILALTDKSPVLSLRQIIAQTSLESDEAEFAIKKLLQKAWLSNR
ncbi:hypothetical protein AGMMS4952_23670 [Spirochaetia bacterium]|nr:hypothetical protein AGMMS4952_23670 [Spirochaetia bacterium]